MLKSHTLNHEELKEHGFEFPDQTSPEFHTELIKRMKKAFVLAHLNKSNYCVSKAAETIGVPIPTLYKLMKELGIPTKTQRLFNKAKELVTGKTT